MPMLLEGSIRTSGPAETVLLGLTRVETLTAISPAGFEFRTVEGGVAEFVIRRGFGPITLTLQGKMSVEKADAGYKLEIKAAHLIGGRVLVALDATCGEAEGQGILSWKGELTAQGMAGRLLSERSDRANEILGNLFIRLRDHVEGAAA
ncbi:hypothetical protein [Stagnihabitans tardus]|uniref:Carbon monoxide dehydrogenase n=1 Tax=Stagnihabitans tardus TaxID=2699202 RepID=A0AAE5BVB3_9RHOB|nr:hypothetical protein [Stagnihabitans tardus]NBZ88057.1 hypothetical protein [Stagnihabitans tardus]